MLLKQVKKAKPATPAKVESTEAEKDLPELTLEEVADRFGSLSDQAEALMASPVFGHLELVTGELKKRLADFEPGEQITIVGKEWKVEATPCSLTPRKVVNMTTVMEMMGMETFLSVASITLSNAEKYLTPEQLAQVMVGGDTFTTNRKISKSYLGKTPSKTIKKGG